MMSRTLILCTMVRCAMAILMLSVSIATSVAAEADLALQEQQALQAAVQRVAESVVQIRTVGGLDRVGRTLIAQGPTTGLVVGADGYIVSSAFNFAQHPTSILVRLPSGEQMPAQLVAHDKNRMLVLLKVNADEQLPVPSATPADEMRVGQWAVAVGRTFRADRVAVSVGIISALDRMFGRVIQTDANVSIANYGGPLVDLQGRVLGIILENIIVDTCDRQVDQKVANEHAVHEVTRGVAMADTLCEEVASQQHHEQRDRDHNQESGQ